MYPFKAHLKEFNFLLNQVFHLSQIWAETPDLNEIIDLDLGQSVLEEASKFIAQKIYPLNCSGDKKGVVFDSQQVFTPDGLKEVYRDFANDGWQGINGDPEFGGMGMPMVISILIDEMLYGANTSFSLYNALTSGASKCLSEHADNDIKQNYLPHLYSGRWTASMDMTEPHSGSDLGHIQTKAEITCDGHYHITGTKIFITNGEHDLTENIIHLVLAKTPNSKAVSLFVVPKFLVNPDGSLGDRNNIFATSVEDKMGIKASPTCTIQYDGALGYLVGKPNRGLIYMLTMMNVERLSIGMQGLGLSQRAYDIALQYAKERKQGTSFNANKDVISASLINHGDVRRMLLTIRCLNDAGRALAVFTALQIDIASHGEDKEQRKQAKQFSALLIPVVKAFLTDRSFESTVLAQQILGGHGYICEMEIEQLVRDARIAQIYEGTNGIQAIDFLTRKVLGDNLQALQALLNNFRSSMASFKHIADADISRIEHYFEELISLSVMLNEQKLSNPMFMNAIAVYFLNAFGYIIYGYFWLLLAEKSYLTNDDEFIEQKHSFKEFYFSMLLNHAKLNIQSITSDAEVILNFPETLF